MVVEKLVSPVCLAITCRRVHRASPDNVAYDYGNFTAGSHLAAIAGYFDYMLSKRAKDSPSNG
jgi:hypothetical protein